MTRAALLVLLLGLGACEGGVRGEARPSSARSTSRNSTREAGRAFPRVNWAYPSPPRARKECVATR